MQNDPLTTHKVNPDASESRASVLLVDDRPANRLALQAVLQDPGYDLITAASGEEALGLLLDRDFAAVLLGVPMQGLDGLETARLIRGRQRSRHTPIIFLTADGDGRLPAEQAYALGAVDYLVEPLVPVILRAKVAGFVELFRKAEQLRQMERRDFERKLAEENARFRALTEHSSDAVSLLAADGTVMYSSPSSRRLLGYEPGEFVGRSGFEIVHPDDRQRIGGRLAELARGPGTTVTEEMQVRHKDGSWRWVECVGTNLLAEPTVAAIVVNFRDITERRRATEALRQSEDRFARFMQHLPGLAWIKDRDGRYVFANDAATTAFRTHRADLYGKTDEEIFPPRTAAQFKENDRRALAGGAGVQVVETLGHADGVVHHSLVSKFPIPGLDGRAALVGGMAIDVTEQVRTQAVLEESEQRLRTLSDNLPRGAIYQVTQARDGQPRFTYVSAGVERLFGVTPGEVLADGNALYGLIHEEDQARVRAAEEAALRSMAPFDCEFRSRTRSGGLVWVHCRSAPRRLPSAEVVWEGVVMDVTDRKATEERLRHSEARSRRLVEANLVGVGVSDAAGNWLEANDELLRIIGFNGEELRSGKARWVDQTPAKYLPLDERGIAEAGQRGACTPYEKEYAHKDGSHVPVLIGYAPLDEGEGRFICFVLDLTPQKRVEEALQEADRRKDEFLAMLAHELRNPLGPIRNAAQVVKLLGPGDPNLQRASEMIDRQVGHLVRLVDDLLDVSRITRGKIKLQREPLELATVVAHAVEASRPLIDARRHALAVTLPPDPVLVEGDATRLAQVVANLMNNAAKYTEEGGHIWLTVEQGPGEAVLRVRDDGIGIPADLLPRVFDLFTQGDRSLARSEGGLGIGLTLVKSLVEMQGGRVEAFSEGPGRGSEVVVRLPVLERRGRRLGGGEGGTARAAPRRVLVVDDNADAAASLAMLLQGQGHEVRTAHDGPAALDAAREFRPGVVFLDIGLPRMDGYEVARRLRGQAGRAEMRLVALTGYGQEEDRRLAAEAGFDVHLTKPANPADLQRVLAAGDPTGK